VVTGAIPGQTRNGADFNFGYQPINGNYPTASPGSYQVANGDTLQSIAQGAYGDSALWYRIADANGLADNSDLRTGQTLSIPNRVGTVHNSGANSAVGASGTFKPYDPSKVQGDTTPNLPAPQAEDGGCGGFGQILVIIVAIVVTVVTYGADSFNLSAPPESYPPPFRQSSQWARWCCR
jgi:LysM repeat protein